VNISVKMSYTCLGELLQGRERGVGGGVCVLCSRGEKGKGTGRIQRGNLGGKKKAGRGVSRKLRGGFEGAGLKKGEEKRGKKLF